MRRTRKTRKSNRKNTWKRGDTAISNMQLLSTSTHKNVDFDNVSHISQSSFFSYMSNMNKRYNPFKSKDYDGVSVDEIRSVIESEEKVPYTRCRVSVVGEARVGKTSLIKALLNKPFLENEYSTPGMSVEKMLVNDWMEKPNVKNGLLPDQLEQEIDGAQSLETSETAAVTVNRRNSVLSYRSVADSVQTAATGSTYIGEEELNRVVSKINKTHAGSKLIFWDFGGQDEYYAMHHLFLSRHGIYIIVFNLANFFVRVQKSLAYIKFRLFSMRLFSSEASILLVGTHAESIQNNTANYFKKVNDAITHLLDEYDFFVEQNEKYCFFPVSNSNRTQKYFKQLKLKIDRVVSRQSYLKQAVPVTYLRFYDILIKQKRGDKLDNVPQVRFHKARKLFESMTTRYDFFECLEFLSSRGIVTYFISRPKLQQRIILKPKWLAAGLSKVFCLQMHRSEKLRKSKAYRRLVEKKIIELDLMRKIWREYGYSKKEILFFSNVLVDSLLLIPLLENQQAAKNPKYLIPSLHFSLFEDELFLKNDNRYTGPQFMIDFTGDYDQLVYRESLFGDVEKYLTFLPFTFYERLLCLCINHSLKEDSSALPRLFNQRAEIEYTDNMHFEISVQTQAFNTSTWIVISTYEGTKMNQARELVEHFQLLINGLKDRFLENLRTDRKLSACILIPANKQQSLLANYATVKESIVKKKQCLLRPDSKEKVDPYIFSDWICKPDEKRHIVRRVSFVLRRQVHNIYPLTEDFDFHLFLSHKQTTGADIVSGLYYLFEKFRLKSFWDRKYERDRSTAEFARGIKRSMVFVLVLTKDIFPASSTIKLEIETAVQTGKEIVLLHHPNTGRHDYCQFADYIRLAPVCLKPFFAKESIRIDHDIYNQEFTKRFLQRVYPIVQSFVGLEI